MTTKLKRTKQCKKCPWKVSTNPHDIPNGYCETKHANLESTIASGSALEQLAKRGDEMHVMACHETDDAHCVGWLNHQLGEGNNILLRLAMRNCENLDKLQLDGEQHQTFEDTLPK